MSANVLKWPNWPTTLASNSYFVSLAYYFYRNRHASGPVGSEAAGAGHCVLYAVDAPHGGQPLHTASFPGHSTERHRRSLSLSQYLRTLTLRLSLIWVFGLKPASRLSDVLHLAFSLLSPTREPEPVP
jgi:hypothetical protein